MVFVILLQILLLLQIGISHIHISTITMDSEKNSSVNNYPIIGVLAQLNELQGIEFIAATYVKFLEMAGGRVVPIFVTRDKEYYRLIVSRTNGLLLPGGGRNIMSSSYANAAEFLFEYITEANDRGEYYPIWGVCQGFQMLTVLVLKNHHNDLNPYWLTDCAAADVALSLDFVVAPNATRMFATADKNIINLLTTENVTPNYHKLCMTPENFYSSGLNNSLDIISTSFDQNGTKFISTYESRNDSRPMYGLQWHPEKIGHEFKSVKYFQENIPHSASAIKMSQFMANFFVNECRKSLHKFPTPEIENEALIYNYNPRFHNLRHMGEDAGEFFTQIYEFDLHHEVQDAL